MRNAKYIMINKYINYLWGELCKYIGTFDKT